jgi:hypothetical protein
VPITQTQDSYRRFIQPEYDNQKDLVFDPTLIRTRLFSKLPPPENLGVPEKNSSPFMAISAQNVLWRRAPGSLRFTSTKPLTITQNPMQKETNPADKPSRISDEPHERNPSALYEKTITTSNIQQNTAPKNTAAQDSQINESQAQLQATQPLPAFHQIAAKKTSTTPQKNPDRIPVPEPPQPQVTPNTNPEISPVELEKIEAIPVPHRVNRQYNEQKKLRGTLTLMAWAFSLVIVLLLALAGFGGWELWKRISSAETLAVTINSDLRIQLQQTAQQLEELEKLLKETRATTLNLSDHLQEETSQRNIFSNSVSALNKRFEELENNVTNRLRLISFSEQDVQDLRKEVMYLRESLSVQKNQTASEITTLQRRLEAVENFLINATQRNQEQQNRR